MLPAAARLTRRDEFAAVVRRGRRGGRSRLVVHLMTQPEVGRPRAGLIVGRTVGNAVVRHRVARRLRHLLMTRLPELPSGSRLVVRALPDAGGATFGELAADLDAGLRAAMRGGVRG